MTSAEKSDSAPKTVNPKKARPKQAQSEKVKIKRGRRRLYNRAPASPPPPPSACTSTQTKAPPVHTAADPIIQKFLTAAVLAASMPLPALDIAAVTTIQIQMLRALARLYKVPIAETAGKALIASLIGGLSTVVVGAGVFGSLIKMVPGVGTLLGPTAVPATAGAATYALGKVFVQHFEAGGTFLDFDPQKSKAYFARLYRAERQPAANRTQRRRQV